MNNEVIQKINENQNLIRKVCLMYAKTEQEADDMFQEICIQIWDSYKNFKGTAKFTTWLYRISINTAVSWIRKENKYMLRNADYEYFNNNLQETNSFYEQREKKEEIKILHICIKKLKEIDRTLIMLYLDEVSYADISEITGLSVANIKVKINRIKKQLKKLIEEYK